MPFDLNEYEIRLRATVAANTNHARGSALEELSAYLFDSLDGVIVSERNANLPAEEIDIVLWNPQIEEVLRPFEAVILVECKNWTAAVDAQPLDAFISKMRRRSLKTGIFVAANGVTGQFLNGAGADIGARGIISAALQEGIRVIVLTFAEISALACVDDLRALIRRKYCGIYVGKLHLD